MAPHVYKIGEEVNIVGGLYKKQGRGVYKGPYGKKNKMCVVQIIDGEQRYTRNIYLSSIEPAKKRNSNSKIEIERSELVAIKDELLALQQSVQRLTLRINELEQKI